MRDNKNMIVKIPFLLLFLLSHTSTLFPGDFPVMQEWKQLAEVMHYTPDNLWEYINGAADQFIDYGFQAADVGEFESEGVQFSVDIYDMGLPLNAFGVYATESRGIKNRYKIGAEAAMSLPSQALMYQGKYYIKIYAFKGEFQERTGKNILEGIAKQLDGETLKPAELLKLPDENKIPGSEGYVRLGFLGLSDLQNCLYADYQDESGENYKIFLIHHQDSSLEETFNAIDKSWQSQSWKDYPIKTRKIPYQGLTAIILHPQGLYGVSDAADIHVIHKRLEFLIER